jgi:tRNA(Arg) A34 adenosine deaminase TadA
VTAHEGWDSLPAHWQRAFSQAWAAYGAGTIPVGAVVVDPRGVIAAEARNRVYDVSAPPVGQLSGSWVAHAELNALAQIAAKRSTAEEGWAVYSTLEPCPLCAGAIMIALRGRITVGYASPDPIGGGLGALGATRIGQSREWRIEKLGGPFAVFAELLHAVCMIAVRPTGRTARHYGASRWRPLIESQGPAIAEARDRRQSVEQIVAVMWPAIEHAEVGVAGPPSA